MLELKIGTYLAERQTCNISRLMPTLWFVSPSQIADLFHTHFPEDPHVGQTVLVYALNA